MKQLLSLGLGTAALTTFAVCATQPAQAAQFFNFSYAYSGVTANGTLQTNDGNGDGSFTIQDILGKRNGIAITSLVEPGLLPGGNTIDRNDNLLFPKNALPVNFNGFSYTVASGEIQAFNLFASNNFPGTIREFNTTQGSQPSDSGFQLQVAADAPVVPTAAVPTPALLPGLIGMGIAAIRKKKAAAKQA